MADALIGKTEVDAASLELVSRMLNKNLQRALTMPGKFMDLSSEATQSVDKIKIRKFGDLSVSDKAENTPVDAQISTLSTDDLDLSRHRVIQTLAEDLASMQGPASFLSELAENAAIKIAQDWDSFLITTLLAGVSLAAPDHLVNWDNDPTDTFSKGDVINAGKLLDVQNVPSNERYLGIHPDNYAQLLAISDFVESDKMGTSNIASGVVGQVFGFSVVKNSGFTSDEPVFWHKGCMAAALQMSPRVQTDYDLANLAQRYSIDYVGGAKVVKPASIVKIIDGGA